MSYVKGMSQGHLLSEKGVEDAINFYEWANQQLSESGVFMTGKALNKCKFQTCDSWNMMAVIDFVSDTYFVEVTNGQGCAWQHKIYRKHF